MWHVTKEMEKSHTKKHPFEFEFNHCYPIALGTFQLVTELLSDGGVRRTAPATPGLLKT